MGFFFKLREWVGTVTGKGVSWGRDSVGRSAPAFMAASTPALPPPTCTARGRLHLQAAVVFAARPANCGPFVASRPEPGGESAGCVRLQWLVQQAFCCLPPFACHAHWPHQHLAPVHFALPRPLCFACHLFLPCAPGSPSVRAGGLLSVRASSLFQTTTSSMFASCKTAP